MTSPLRIALIGDGVVPELAAGLRDTGHEVTTIRATPIGAAEQLLARRGFTGPLTPLPATVARLLRARADVAHAMTVPDAASALAWRRLVHRPVVFTCSETLSRATVADRRLRLQLLEAATASSDAVLAADERAREALVRWLMVDAPVIAPGDAAAHARLYASLV